MPQADARILIVDGQIAVARLVAKIFGIAGLPNIDIAFDTPTAREKLIANVPDIAILDARIAPMAVTAFITLIRKLTNGRAVTLVMTTSRTSEAVEAACEAGVDGVLLKPFTPSDLKAQLALASKKKEIAPVRNGEGSLRDVVAFD